MSGVTQHRGSRLLPVALAAALLLSGCIWTGWPFHRNKPGEIVLPQRPDPKQAVATEGLGWKEVTGKREPHFLIARDGTECTVTAAKWEEFPIGTKAFCVWGKQES